MAMRFLRRFGVLPRRAKALFTMRRQCAAERRALRDIVGKPHDHWLDDAGLTRDDAQRLHKQSNFSRIANWLSAVRKGGGSNT